MEKLAFKLLSLSFIVTFLSSIICWLAFTEYTTLNLSISIFSLCLLFGLFFIKRIQVKKYVVSSHFNGLVNTIISSFLVFSIIGVVNYLSYKNSKQWDLTQQKVNSLTDKSKAIISQVLKPLELRLYGRKKFRNQLMALLEVYKMENSYISLEYYDPDLFPTDIEKFQLTKKESLVLIYEGRTRVTFDLSESGITNALLGVIRKRSPIIYFSQGNGEPKVFDQSEDGLSMLKDSLEKKYLTIRPYVSLSRGEIPRDADVFVILAPTKKFDEVFVESLKNFLENGGKLLIGLGTSLKDDPFINLRTVLAGFGLNIKNNLVIDKKDFVNGSNGWVPIIKNLDKKHFITKFIEQSIFFPVATQIETFSESRFLVNKLAQTSQFPMSFAENNFEKIIDNNIEYNSEEDAKGPIVVAATTQSKKESGSKIVAIGNGTFVQNRYASQGGNLLFAMNALTWLSDEEALITRSKENENQLKILSSQEVSLVFFVSVLFLPFVLFLIAIFIYRKKKKL